MSRIAIHTEDAPQAIGPYSQALAVELSGGEKLIFTASQLGLDPAKMELVPGGIENQTKQAIDNLSAVLAEAGAGWEDVVKAVVFLADMEDFATFNEIYAKVVGDPPPARSAVAVRSLPKGGLVAIELVALTGCR